MGTKILREKEAVLRAGISRSSVRRLEKLGLFPARRQLSPGRIGYLEAEVDQWIESRIKVGGESLSSLAK